MKEKTNNGGIRQKFMVVLLLEDTFRNIETNMVGEINPTSVAIPYHTRSVAQCSIPCSVFFLMALYHLLEERVVLFFTPYSHIYTLAQQLLKSFDCPLMRVSLSDSILFIPIFVNLYICVCA